MKIFTLIPWLFVFSLIAVYTADARKNLPFNSIIIPLDMAAADDGSGGLIAADVNDDLSVDILITTKGYIGAYTLHGTKIWSKNTDIRLTSKSERDGLPGLHSPGIQAGDINGDGKTEVIYLDTNSTIHILQGRDGTEIRSIQLHPPTGTKQWENVVIADFRGQGDKDILLQATNEEGYRYGKYLAAYAFERLQAGNTKPLWRCSDFGASAHSGVRIADMDGDGRDEVVGGTILDPQGKVLVRINLQGHIDSVFIGDIQPATPGLEAVILEEGGLNRIFLVNTRRVLWESHYNHQEPQNAVIGKFIKNQKEMQVWCRSRNNKHQNPFIFDAFGSLLNQYQMDKVAPPGWTSKGVELIHSIWWTDENRQYACAKERHKEGDIGIFDPISGQFVLRISEQTSRLYVADVMNDWREEIIVWHDKALHIYFNPDPGENKRDYNLWNSQLYRRSKMTWNYYNP